MGQENRRIEEVERERRRRVRRFWICVLLWIGYVTFSLLFGEKGVREYRELRATRDRLSRESEELRLHIGELREEVKALKTDPFTIEKIARERLGLVRRGEIVYRFLEEGP